ncbi:MAG: hypothetical protein QUS33_12175 [Dehalococcoidia bacterium]|nr:hypothetical protein [Dehalococcoidia bacterium]
MAGAAREAESAVMVIRPRLGTGWEITVDDLTREVRLQFKLLRLTLPIKRRIPFSEVVRVAVVCRESWWSRAGDPWGFVQNLVMFRVASLPHRAEDLLHERTVMPTRGWRYDLLMTQKGGHTARLGVLRSPDAADELAGQLRRRVGLPPAH